MPPPMPPPKDANRKASSMASGKSGLSRVPSRMTVRKKLVPPGAPSADDKVKPRAAKSTSSDMSGMGGERKQPSVDTDEKNRALFKMLGKSLLANQWYHGMMPREDCEALLKEEGDFLVRYTTVNKAPLYCISVLHAGESRHIPVHFTNGMWSLKDVGKPALSALIDYLLESKHPIPPSGAVLSKPVYRPDYYILHDHITLEKKLGAGAFGEVYIGTLKRKNEKTKTLEETKCAIKRCKGAVNKKQLADFVKEAKLMRRFDHQNIVRMYGIAPQEEPIMIVLELAEGGSVKSYCFNHPDISYDQLLTWSVDGARGMAYLSGRTIIHRDLAARNCLLGGQLELKISDFGLSIADQTKVQYNKLKQMPTKWLSPETLSKGEFTSKTDVWSFGVMMWELFSRCVSDPFPGMTNMEARQKILSGQEPMAPPEGSPELAVTVMRMCWTQDPMKRPDFVKVLSKLAPKETPPKPLEPWESFVD